MYSVLIIEDDSTIKNDSKTFLDATELNLSKYLLKPIKKDELLHAVKSSIDELKNYHTISLNKIELKSDLIWDRDKFELINNDTLVELTPKEKKMLDFLLIKPNTTRTYEEIISSVWKEESIDKKSLKTTATNLRKKVPSLELENIYSIGYRVCTT